VDLIAEQLATLPAAKPLSLRQEGHPALGHAIEMRHFNAEDPQHNFRPVPEADYRWLPSRRNLGSAVEQPRVYTGYKIPPCLTDSLSAS